jgi:hypothetical protein
MAINKLYFSHFKYDWKKNNTKLLNSNNLNQILADDISKDYHTSINDIKFENIQTVVQAAKEIILVELDLLHSDIHDCDYFTYGRLINELFRVKEKVKGFAWVEDLNHNFFNSLIKTRHIDNTVLWTVGCSVTYGIGVDPEQRWGSLLSKELYLPEISLSIPGGSIGWAADQILRSDIRAGDIVVWGLTDVSRVEYSNNWALEAIPVTGYSALPKKLQHYNLDYFDSQTKFLQAIKAILQVNNYCEKIGSKLYMINLMDTCYFNVVFHTMPNYIDCAVERNHYGYNDPLNFIDLGTDGHHPGPKQHQHYAEQILKLIKENNYGN